MYGFFIGVFFILFLVAAFFGIRMFIEAIQEKGWYRDKTGLLWFVGLCWTPFMVGLLALALPDRGNTPAPTKHILEPNSEQQPAQAPYTAAPTSWQAPDPADELPSL